MKPSNIILIGMAGSGKTTIGKLLAKQLQWEWIDTDHLIEKDQNKPLQQIVESLNRSDFLSLEQRTILKIHPQKTVISTGGSSVYGKDAMRHLKSSGLVVYLDADPRVLLERINAQKDRGLIIEKDQTIENLITSREQLYKSHADLIVRTDKFSTDDCVKQIINYLER